jgi:hypothetical protein
MNKNIIHTFVCERKKGPKHSHEITSTIKTFIQMYNKRRTHVQLITFLKEKYYLDACYGEYDQPELDKITTYNIT